MKPPTDPLDAETPTLPEDVPAKATTQERLSGEITRNIIDILENGEPVFDRDGEDRGRRPASASFITAAIRWHEIVKKQDGSHEKPMGLAEAIKQLDAARETGGDLPPVDMETD